MMSGAGQPTCCHVMTRVRGTKPYISADTPSTRAQCVFRSCSGSWLFRQPWSPAPVPVLSTILLALQSPAVSPRDCRGTLQSAQPHWCFTVLSLFHRLCAWRPQMTCHRTFHFSSSLPGMMPSAHHLWSSSGKSLESRLVERDGRIWWMGACLRCNDMRHVNFRMRVPAGKR